MRSRLAVLGIAVLVALLAFLAWREGQDQTGATGTTPSPTAPAEASPDGQEPTAATTGPGEPGGAATTPAVPSPTAAVSEPSPSPAGPATASPPAEVAPPTPSPGVRPGASEPLVGEVRRSDPSGDLADSAGQPPASPQPAADITEVLLSGDGEDLRVAFTLAGDVPSQAGSLVWSVDVWLDEEDLAYTITVQRVGSQLVAGVLDWEAGEQLAPPDPPVADGATVTVDVPREMLVRVNGPFLWQAVAQADGGYEDHVPADGVLDWFPGPDG